MLSDVLVETMFIVNMYFLSRQCDEHFTGQLFVILHFLLGQRLCFVMEILIVCILLDTVCI